MRRKNRFDIYEEAAGCGPYDERPMLELGIDPQLHLSRNAVPQPFFLVCEKDCVIAQMGGAARLEFRGASVRYFDLAVGDLAYIPGGVPHRLLPATPSIHLRYKAALPGFEHVAWYGEEDEEIARIGWDCAQELPQEGYLRACRTFNDTLDMRRSRRTDTVLPAIDLGQFRWAEVADAVREAEAVERPRAERLAASRVGAGGEPGPAPAAAPKVPLKANVFEFARIATTSLAPLFPYLGPGAIVPCAALHHHETGAPVGYFIHHNTVQEVNVCYGGRGTFRKTGAVSVGPYEHGVGEKPGQAPAGRDAMSISLITQRQAESAGQSEGVGFVCEQCGGDLHWSRYDAHALPDPLDAAEDDAIRGLPTIAQSAAAAENFNAQDSLRTCRQCGHVNPPFPVEHWGWSEYRRRTRLVLLARGQLAAAGEDAVTASQPARDDARRRA